MIKKISLLVVLLTIAQSLCAAIELTEERAKEFFNKVQATAKNFDPSVADFYADDAKISVVKKFPDGSTMPMAMTGKMLKSLVTQIMPKAKEVGDYNDFSDISVSIENNRGKIKAKRYSNHKKYTDDEYYMVIAANADGDIKIVEEFITMIETNIPAGKPTGLETKIIALKNGIEKLLPLVIDEATRLDAVSANGNTLEYSYTIIGTSADDIEAAHFKSIMYTVLVESVCANAVLADIFMNGGTLKCAYSDESKKPITEISITKEDCAKINQQSEISVVK